MAHLPRLIRLRDAPAYLGMDRNRFNAEVRPLIRETTMGVQGIVFDRLDLDAWADDYMNRNGRAPDQKGVQEWGKNECQDSGLLTATGTSRSESEAMERFERQLKRKTLKRPNDILCAD